MINKLLFTFKIINPTNIIHMERLNYYLCYNPDWKSGVIVKDDPEELTSKLVSKIPAIPMEDLVKDLFKRKDCKQVIIQNTELKFNYKVSYTITYKFTDHDDEVFPVKLSMEIEESDCTNNSKIRDEILSRIRKVHNNSDYVTQCKASFIISDLKFTRIK